MLSQPAISSAQPLTDTSFGVAAPVLPRSKTLPVAFYLAVLLSCGVALLTPNPLLSAAAILVLALLILLFWRPGEPPILLWAVVFPWIQVVTAVLQADFAGETLVTQSFRAHTADAIWLSLVGIAVLAIGMRVASRSIRPIDPLIADQQLSLVSLNRLFILYLGFALLSSIVSEIQSLAPSLAQAIWCLVSLKWAFYFLLGYLTLRRRSKRFYFVFASLLELASGIGFFAEFRLVFFVGILVILSVHFRL